MDIINQYLKDNYRSHKVSGFVKEEIPETTKRLECKDGFSMSCQASEFHYCTPRENRAWPYERIEIGFPNLSEDLLMDYAEDPDDPTATVYGYVPVDVVNQVIEKHGGIKA